MAYPTLAEIKTYLNITGSADDVYLQATLDAVISSIEEYCQRVFPLATVTEEVFNLTGEYHYQVNRWPIVDVTVFDVTEGSIEISSLRLDKPMGDILTKTPIRGDLTVTYNGGYDPLPAYITYVINESVKSAYNNKDSDPAQGPLKSERVDGAATLGYYAPSDYAAGSGGGGNSAPLLIASFSSMLDTYRSEHAFGAW